MNSRKHDSSHHVYLLDTMNNVLGILILVLILTQVVGVSESGLIAVPEAQLSEMQKKLQLLTTQAGRPLEQMAPQELKDRQAQNLTEERELEDQIAALSTRGELFDPALREHLNTIARSIKSAHDALKDVKSRAFLEEEVEKIKQQVSEAMDKRQAGLSQLKGLQDETAHAGNVVSIGTGRPAVVMVKPDIIVAFVCRNGMLGVLDWKALHASLHEANQKWVADPNSGSGWGAFARYVNAGDYGDVSFRVRLQAIPDGSGFYMIAEPRYGSKWASSTNLADEVARMQKKLAAFDSQKTVVQFFAYGNSFGNYVDLVQAAKKLGFKTSWIPMDDDEPLYTTVQPGKKRTPPPNQGIPTDSQ